MLAFPIDSFAYLLIRCRIARTAQTDCDASSSKPNIWQFAADEPRRDAVAQFDHQFMPEDDRRCHSGSSAKATTLSWRDNRRAWSSNSKFQNRVKRYMAVKSWMA